jgi:hypothetical protein
MARKEMTLIRFALYQQDRDSQVPEGILAVAYRLRDGTELDAGERAQISESIEWFKKHLPVPDRFNRSTRPGVRPKAISWFKPTASEHVSRMDELSSFLTAHGYNVRTIKTEKPGFVVYEDDFQLVAEPFAETPV